MTYDYPDANKKQRKRSKVFFEQFLFESREPKDDVANDSPPELEAELLDNSLSMTRRFRHIAQRLRNRD